MLYVKTKNMIRDIPIVNITIYKLDIYRLLTLLLADKQIAKNPVFKNLGNDNFDNEVNRLLILISAVTRQLLDNTRHKLENNECGDFWHAHSSSKCNFLPLKSCTWNLKLGNIFKAIFE